MGDQLQILMELEKRGELPESKMAILNELRNRKVVSSDNIPVKSLKNSLEHLKQVQGFAMGAGETMPSTKIAESVSRLILGDKLPSDKFKEEAPTATKIGKIAGETAQFMAGSAGAKAIPFLASKTLLPSMARGALANVGVQQNQDLNPSNIPMDASLGAGGELLGALGSAIGKGTTSAGERLINAALKLSKKDAKAGVNIGRDIIARFSRPRTISGFQSEAEKGLAKNENQLQEILSSYPNESISPARSIENASQLLSKPEYAAAGEQPARTSIQSVIEDFVNSFRGGGEGSAVGNIPLSEANAMKRGLYEAVGSKSYLPDVSVAAKKDAQKALARGLRESLETVDPNIAPINQELKFFGKLNNLSKDVMADQSRKGVNLTLSDILVGGAPSAAAYSGGGTAALSPELLLPLLAKKLLIDSPSGKLNVGLMMGKLGQALQKTSPALRLTGPLTSSFGR